MVKVYSVEIDDNENYNFLMRKRFWIYASIFLLVVACQTTPVTGRSALILMSFGQEVALGAQAYEEMLDKETISTDGRLNAILKRVGERIAAASDMPDLDWEFKLIDSKQKNAFALPGGKVAFYKGILEVCKNEAGIAAVMGHEVAHAIARHGAQRMTQQLLITAGLTAVSISLSNNRHRRFIMGALGLGTTVGLALPYSRENESEADHIGIIYMAKAGYDPKEAVKFWARFRDSRSAEPPEILSTHPNNETRIARLKKLLSEAEKKYRAAPNKHGVGENL